MRGLPSILLTFCNKFNKFDKTGGQEHECLIIFSYIICIYQMNIKITLIFLLCTQCCNMYEVHYKQYILAKSSNRPTEFY